MKKTRYIGCKHYMEKYIIFTSLRTSTSAGFLISIPVIDGQLSQAGAAGCAKMSATGTQRSNFEASVLGLTNEKKARVAHCVVHNSPRYVFSCIPNWEVLVFFFSFTLRDKKRYSLQRLADALRRGTARTCCTTAIIRLNLFASLPCRASLSLAFQGG